MPRQKRFPPYPKKSHSSGQARIKIRGRHRFIGVFGSKESWAEYKRLLNDWSAGRLDLSAKAAPPTSCRTVAELIAHWWLWAEKSQLEPDGSLKCEVVNRRFAYEPLARLYGQTHVADFGRKALQDLQAALVSGSWLTEEEVKAGRRGWCRNFCNRNVSRVKALFAWGELRELLPEGSAARFAVVKGMSEGEHGVRETDEVPPVPAEVVMATLPFLRPVVRAVIELLALTGARPSELLALRPCDLNRTGSVELARGYRVQLGEGVWAYQPRRHKTARKGLRRVVLFGPQAQAELRPFLESREQAAFLFSPAEEVERWRAEQRANRKSKVQPSQQCRKKTNPKRPPANRYDHRSLLHAVTRATEKVIGPVQGFGPCPHWSPYQLRHLAATNLAEEFGAEVAMIVLGHRHMKTTAIYALPSLKKAADAAKQAG